MYDRTNTKDPWLFVVCLQHDGYDITWLKRPGRLDWGLMMAETRELPNQSLLRFISDVHRNYISA